MNNIIKYIMICSASILTLSGCADKSQDALNQNVDAKAVNYIETKTDNFPVYLPYKGFVTADEVRNMSFELAGSIKTVEVETGQKVSKGDVLATLDTVTVNMKIDNANQNILLAKNLIEQVQNTITKIDSGIEGEKLNLKQVELGIEVEELNLKKIEDSYKSAIDKIMISYNQVKENYDNIIILYDSGVAPKQSFDDAKYALEQVETELETTKQNRDNDILLQKKAIENIKNKLELQKINISTMEDDKKSAYTQMETARLQLNQANIELDLYNKELKDAVLKASMDGFVVKITSRPGEIVGVGTPIVIVKSGESVVNIGVSVDDFTKISHGMNVTLKHNEEIFQGKVNTISLYPDEDTGTYNVEIIPEKADLAMGTILDVEIPIEEQDGIFVPIQSVINSNGVNYVYVAETKDGFQVVNKREVVLGDLKGEDILVKNLTPGLIVVTEGVKDLKDNDIVLLK